MKVYSDTLTEEDLREAGRAAGAGYVSSLAPIRRSQLRRRGWIVSLGGGNRWKNTGKHGASDESAATWDQHGWWMAALYAKDPQMVIVAARRYEHSADFHAQTQNKYGECGCLDSYPS